MAYLPAASVVFLACVAFHLLKGTGLFLGDAPARHGPILAALLVLLAPVRAARVAVPLRILHRAILVLFTAFALVSYPTLSEAYYAESAWTEALIRHGRWVAVIAGVLGWWHPGFGLVPILHAAWKKEHLESLYGFSLNATDYYIVMELMVFVILVIGLIALADAGRTRIPGALRRAIPTASWSLGECAFIAAMALHLANYFYSAVAKLTLPGAGPLSWMLENETVYIAVATTLTGLGPLASHPDIAAPFFVGMSEIQVATNALTLGLQLAAILSVIRIRWAILATIVYDLMHFGIFLTTGILFWKWMVVNIGLVIALGTLRARGNPPWPLVVMAIGLLVLSPKVFRIAHLGWFDTRALNRPIVEAVLDDGRLVDVPSNYFLEGATQMAKASIGFPFPGHFERIGVFGKALDGREGMRAAARCDLPTAEKSGLSGLFEADPRLGAFFRRHHDFMLARAGDDGRVAYDLFAHHNWANPLRFAEFRSVDLRRIVAYRYIIESVCLTLREDGTVAQTLELRGSHVIDVDRHPGSVAAL